MNFPQIILLISGKRKSGKDFICDKLKNLYIDNISRFTIFTCSNVSRFKDNVTIVQISGPVKKLYASEHQLDFNELLSDSPYKEQYRMDMIKWSDNVREKTPEYFCKAACEAGRKTSPICKAVINCKSCN